MKIILSTLIVACTIMIATSIESCTYNSTHKMQVYETKRLQINMRRDTLFVNIDSLIIEHSRHDEVRTFESFDALAFYIDNYTGGAR